MLIGHRRWESRECRAFLLSKLLDRPTDKFFAVAKEISDLLKMRQEFRALHEIEPDQFWKSVYDRDSKPRLIAVTLGTFSRLAQNAPWSPQMSAWSGEPVPRLFLDGTTALQRQGALVFQAKQCRNCHSLGETGGQRGPALDSVAVRLTQDQLIRQVIQGGGNMPAYGTNLSPAETTALVAFLRTLHPAGQAPARDASRDVVLGEPGPPAAAATR